MTLTEEEAKTKRCQESFPAADGLSIGGFIEAGPVTMNTVATPAGMSWAARQTAPVNCIGSACMAWRWVDVHTGTDKGYCGKASIPCHAKS